MTDPAAEIRVALVADFTIAGLAPFLRTGEAPALTPILAPFDQVVSVLLNEDAECWKRRPDIAVVWTRPNAAVKSFSRLLDLQRVSLDDVLADVDRFADAIRAAAKRVSLLFVPIWTWPAYDRGLGALNFDVAIGPAYALARMNTRLAEALAQAPNVRLLDAARWMTDVGPTADSAKSWFLGKIPFGHEVFSRAALDLKAAVRALKGDMRKVVIVDLDDTLWAGIVGDVGWQNLNLGGHDPIGEALIAFQLGLKRLTRRGVVLAIVSKNTESVALEAIDRHPEMALRRHDFAGWRINWDDKVENIVALTAELNLGLDSVVFIDDNPAERARVRDALPDVFVPEWPVDKLTYAQALSRLTCFDTLVMSDEDQARTRMYVSERARETARRSAQSLDDYLASLQLKVCVEHLNQSNLVRAAQLLNKTNQMNLATRRMSETQFLQWSSAGDHHVFVFRVSDRFDDYGLTGIASLAVDGSGGQVSDFVLSCRVMGRGVEQTMLHVLAAQARSIGLESLVARPIPTNRNAPCREFFAERSGFSASPDEYRYIWSLTSAYPIPCYVALQQDRAEPCGAEPR